MADLPDWMYYKYVQLDTSSSPHYPRSTNGSALDSNDVQGSNRGMEKTNAPTLILGHGQNGHGQSGHGQNGHVSSPVTSIAFLYGSPSEEGDLELEIIAVNKETYSTSRDTIKLTIQEKER